MESEEGLLVEESQAAIEKKIADTDALLSDARKLVAGTDALFEKDGFSRAELDEILVRNGVAALGAQMRKEEAKASAPKKARKKKAKRARARI